MKTVIILILTIISICDASSFGIEKRRGCSFTNYHEVHVINDLSPNSDAPDSSHPLMVHCASADNDLGYHFLPAQREFNWSFCVNIVQSTLFFCELSWHSIISKSFHVYDRDIGFTCDVTCNWIAKHDGIYFSGNRDPTIGLAKRYYWDEAK